MVDRLCNRIDDILRAVGGDEDALNRFAEAERLGIYMRHGRLYPSALGQTHTSRLASQLFSADQSTFGRPIHARLAHRPEIIDKLSVPRNPMVELDCIERSTHAGPRSDDP